MVFLCKLALETHTFPLLVRGRSEAAAIPDRPRWARAANLLVGRAAYETAVRLYPKDIIHDRDGDG